MTEENENVQVSGLDSKFTKVAMTIVSVLLLFAGPTYVPYLLADVIHVDYIASIGLGAVLFIVGLALSLPDKEESNRISKISPQIP